MQGQERGRRYSEAREGGAGNWNCCHQRSSSVKNFTMAPSPFICFLNKTHTRWNPRIFSEQFSALFHSIQTYLSRNRGQQDFALSSLLICFCSSNFQDRRFPLFVPELYRNGNMHYIFVCVWLVTQHSGYELHPYCVYQELLPLIAEEYYSV